MFMGRGNVLHTMKGKALEILSTEDVASDVSQVQQSEMQVVSNNWIKCSCVFLQI